MSAFRNDMVAKIYKEHRYSEPSPEEAVDLVFGSDEMQAIRKAFKSASAGDYSGWGSCELLEFWGLPESVIEWVMGDE